MRGYTAYVHLNDVRFTQRTCSLYFRCGRHVFSLLADLLHGNVSTDDLQLDVCIYHGQVRTLDHRRCVIMYLYQCATRQRFLIRVWIRFDYHHWCRKVDHLEVQYSDGLSILVRGRRAGDLGCYAEFRNDRGVLGWWLCQFELYNCA